MTANTAAVTRTWCPAQLVDGGHRTMRSRLPRPCSDELRAAGQHPRTLATRCTSIHKLRILRSYVSSPPDTRAATTTSTWPACRPACGRCRWRARRCSSRPSASAGRCRPARRCALSPPTSAAGWSPYWYSAPAMSALGAGEWALCQLMSLRCTNDFVSSCSLVELPAWMALRPCL